MKKRLSLICLSAFILALAHAQCTIDTLNPPQPGFYPDTGTFLKPACQGSHYDEVVQIYVPSSVSIQFGTFPCNYVHLDSIPGLPNGLFYATNPPSGTLPGGERGCINLYGQVNTGPGNYNIVIYYTANFDLFGTPTPLSFTAPYKLHIDTGTKSYTVLYDTACQYPGYYFQNRYLHQSGDYTDTLNNLTGCDSVVELHLHIQSFSTAVTFAGDTFTAPAGYDSYQWINCSDSTPVPGAVSHVYVAPSFGIYAVIMQYNGCTAMSTCSSDISGIDDLNHATFTLYPNPAGNTLQIRTAEEAVLTVQDLSGREVLRQAIWPGHNSIDISHLPGGTYLVAVGNSKGLHFGKLVKY